MKALFKLGREDKYNKTRLKKTNKIVDKLENLNLRNSTNEMHVKKRMK